MRLGKNTSQDYNRPITHTQDIKNPYPHDKFTVCLDNCAGKDLHTIDYKNEQWCNSQNAIVTRYTRVVECRNCKQNQTDVYFGENMGCSSCKCRKANSAIIGRHLPR